MQQHTPTFELSEGSERVLVAGGNPVCGCKPLVISPHECI